MVGKLGSDPKGKIAKAILASLRATVLRRGSCQTFFYLTGIQLWWEGEAVGRKAKLRKQF